MFPNCPYFVLFVQEVIAWRGVKEIQGGRNDFEKERIDMGGVQGRALDDEGLLGLGGRGVTLLKQQTTQKEAIPAPDRPASCVPKCFSLISVQRQQGRDSKHSEEGGKRGVRIVGLLQKGTSLVPGVHKSFKQILSSGHAALKLVLKGGMPCY